MKKQNILIVDADKVTVDWLDKILSEAGFTTRTAANGREALEVAYAHPPDIIILDMVLPDMDGSEVFTQLRREPEMADIFVLVLSSRDSPGEIAAMFNKGVNDYIIKSPKAGIEVLEKCTSFFVRQKLIDRNLPKGHLIGFFSAKGGTGTSTLCVNLATSLAQLVVPKRLVVVDLVLPLGSLSIITGQTDVSSIATITNSFSKFDLDEHIVTSQVWEFSILGSSLTPHQAQAVIPDLIAPLFDVLLQTFDYVVVDFGRSWSPISLPLLLDTDSLVFILGPDMLTVELTRSVLKYLDELGISKKRFFPILNRAVGLEGLTKTQIEDKLELPIVGTVPHARDCFTNASNRQVPYIKKYPNDTITVVLKNLAQQLYQHVKY